MDNNGHYKCQALLLRVSAKLPGGRFIKIFSPQIGVISCFEQKSKAAGSDNAFTSLKPYFLPDYSYVDLDLFSHRGKYYLSDFSVIYRFSLLTRSLPTLAATSLILDLLTDLATDREQARKLWPYTLYALSAVDKLAENSVDLSVVRGIAATYILRSLAESGYRPNLDLPSATTAERTCFSFAAGSLQTYRQTEADSSLTSVQELSGNCTNLLRYICSCPVQRLYNIVISPELSAYLWHFAERWLAYNLEKEYSGQKSLDELQKDSAAFLDLAAQIALKRRGRDQGAADKFVLK